jgi:hypothetical protein
MTKNKVMIKGSATNDPAMSGRKKKWAIFGIAQQDGCGEAVVKQAEGAPGGPLRCCGGTSHPVPGVALG